MIELPLDGIRLIGMNEMEEDFLSGRGGRAALVAEFKLTTEPAAGSRRRGGNGESRQGGMEGLSGESNGG